MSVINKNNYEAFLLDYTEQNLSADRVAALMLFLEQNPELKVELEEFENVTFNTSTSIAFSGKQNVKKAAIEELMIAEIEGLNSPQLSEELFVEIAKNATYQQLFQSYKKTTLIPSTIIFENKSAIKQKETKVIPMYFWYSSAAAVMLLFLLFKNFNNNKVEQLSEATQPNIIHQTVPLISTPKNITESSPLTNHHSSLIPHHSPLTNPQPTPHITYAEKKDSIIIEPTEIDYIIIEPLAMETPTMENDEFLTVSELLKKEVQKRILEKETKNAPTELVAVNLVAKVLGKKAEVETLEKADGKTEAYALNIGGFSFSRKIRQ